MSGANDKIGPVVWLILDGWGIAPASGGNALTQAGAVNLQQLIGKYPATVLTLSGAGVIEKKVNLAKNYLSLGTAKNKLSAANVTLFDILTSAGLRWKILTEPEKMAYGLYYLNNRKDLKPEDYQIISAEMSDDYAETPAMATDLITNELLKVVKSRKVDFVAAIIANLDLVAHRGDFPATVSAAQIIDRNLKNIAKTVLDNSGVLIITAAHGHAEEALDMKTELANKNDTRNPVPLVIVGSQFEGKSFGFMEAPGGDLALVPPAGSLLDVMPTILKIMGLEIPPGLDGRALI